MLLCLLLIASLIAHQAAPSVALPIISYSSNNNRRDLIINGTIAPPGRYPYAVYSQDNDFPFCGGSLIAVDVVLTAAHCIPDSLNNTNITIVIGEYNLTDGIYGDKVEIKENVKHPLYMSTKNDKDYDIALTFLSRPTMAAANNNTSQLVHLNKNNSYPPDNTTATYLGWGVINMENSESSTILREVDVSVIGNDECNQINGTINNIYESYSGLITDNMMCTFAVGKDSCQRDSGGPLIVKDASSLDDIQIGVASWGISCASETFPGVASRVSYSWEFIREHVCNKSIMPPDDFECASVPTAPSNSPSLGSSSSPLVSTTSAPIKETSSLQSQPPAQSLEPQSVASPSNDDKKTSAQMSSSVKVVSILAMTFSLSWCFHL
ncbi:hypothetical protein ACHAWC_005239 [Mediolabrus comicus]